MPQAHYDGEMHEVGNGDDLGEGTSKRQTPTYAYIDAASARAQPRIMRWVTSLIVLILAAHFANFLVRNEEFDWSVQAEFFAHPTVIAGIILTLQVAIVSMIIGIIGGTALAISRMYGDPLLRSAAAGYIWFFRGVPPLVMLVVWYNFGALVPELSFGIPFGPVFASAETNQVVTPFLTAILGLGLMEVAYMAEIVRGGLLAVDDGQREAAQSLGMGKLRMLRRVILPQAMRFIVPPTGNDFIRMTKATSLVSVIALGDLLYSVQELYNRNFEVIPLLLVAVWWYLILMTILTLAQMRLERRFARGAKAVQKGGG